MLLKMNYDICTCIRKLYHLAGKGLSVKCALFWKFSVTVLFTFDSELQTVNIKKRKNTIKLSKASSIVT